MLSQLISGIRNGNLNATSIIIEIIACLVIIFLVLPFHEWAHAVTAYKLGDHSVKYRKRLTINPIEHVDYIGALCLLLFGFGWAKPVPIDSRNFKNPKVGMAITALMGPVANIVAAIAGGLIYCGMVAFAKDFLFGTTAGSYISAFFGFYISVNCSLAVFNLLPIPPLDGSKILFAFLPDRVVEFFYRYQQIFFWGILLLLWIGVLDYPLYFLQGYLLKFVYWICSLPFSFF